MIQYIESASQITAAQLKGGFFDGWPNPPKPETHLKLLRESGHIVVAVDDTSQQVVGFITAITDNILFAYIPLLEVLPAYQHRGIGQELTSRMIAKLQGVYSIDLLCTPNVQPFYEKHGMKPEHAMSLKHYGRQSGWLRNNDVTPTGHQT